jgi:hypothetical protein
MVEGDRVKVAIIRLKAGLKRVCENSKKLPSGAKARRIFNPLRPD